MNFITMLKDRLPAKLWPFGQQQRAINKIVRMRNKKETALLRLEHQAQTQGASEPLLRFLKANKYWINGYLRLAQRDERYQGSGE